MLGDCLLQLEPSYKTDTIEHLLCLGAQCSAHQLDYNTRVPYIPFLKRLVRGALMKPAHNFCALTPVAGKELGSVLFLKEGQDAAVAVGEDG